MIICHWGLYTPAPPFADMLGLLLSIRRDVVSSVMLASRWSAVMCKLLMQEKAQHTAGRGHGEWRETMQPESGLLHNCVMLGAHLPQTHYILPPSLGRALELDCSRQAMQVVQP